MAAGIEERQIVVVGGHRQAGDGAGRIVVDQRLIVAAEESVGHPSVELQGPRVGRRVRLPNGAGEAVNDVAAAHYQHTAVAERGQPRAEVPVRPRRCAQVERELSEVLSFLGKCRQVIPAEFETNVQKLAELEEEARRDPSVNSDRVALTESMLQRLQPDQAPLFSSCFFSLNWAPPITSCRWGTGRPT